MGGGYLCYCLLRVRWLNTRAVSLAAGTKNPQGFLVRVG